MKKIVTLGKLENGGDLHLDILRMIHMSVMASSGGGKTYALLKLLEVTRGILPQCVIDPEGDFTPLRRNRAYDYVLASPKGGDIVAHPSTAAVLARHFVERNFNLLIDLYEMDILDQRRFVRQFFEGLMAAPRKLWRPRLVLVDECQEFAPEKGGDSSESLPAMIRMAKKGRKRGFKLVSATQRPADVSKSLTSQLGNKLIGVAYTDVDQDRAARELRIRDKAKADTLAKLEPGQFYAVGSALGHDLKLVRMGMPKDKPDEGGKSALRKPPAPGPRLKSILAGLATMPQEAIEEARTITELQTRVRTLEGEVRKAQSTIVIPKAPVIQQIAPNPKVLKDMAEKVARKQVMAQADLMIKTLKLFSKDLGITLAKLERDIENMTEFKIKADEFKSQIDIPALTKEQREMVDRINFRHPLKVQLMDMGGIKNIHLDWQKQIVEKANRPVGNKSIGARPKQILNYLCLFPTQQFKLSQMALMIGAPNNGTFSNICSDLTARGLINRDNGLISIRNAKEAVAILGSEFRPRTGTLVDFWKGKLKGRPLMIFNFLLENNASAFTLGELANTLGYPNNGTLSNICSALAGQGVAIRDKGTMKINPDVLKLG